MQKFLPVLPILNLLITYLFLFSFPVNAESNFSTNFSSVYKVDKTGKTTVTQKISLKNLTKNLFAKEFNFSLGSPKIEEIKVKDSLGPIEAEIKKSEESTAIRMTFNDKVVGLDKTLDFSVSYTISDLAIKNGLMWEISIPRLLIEEEIVNYSLVLSVPEEFGELHYVSHEPKDKKNGGYYFEGLNIAKDGVSLSLGKYQVFDFKLKYNLFNPGLFNSEVKVALPPDREYQQLLFDKFDPKPNLLTTDQDGNYLATYSLKGRQRLIAQVNGQVKIVDPHKKLQTNNAEKENPKKYLKADRYWEVNDPAIQKLAKELKTAENIYNYIASNLKYGYDRLKSDRIERLGAVGALANKNVSLCMEFTDLFIAVSRAAGIPARELNGFAYTQNKKLRPTSLSSTGASSDILHAWPEYWDFDSSRWIAVDPTWSSTSGVDYFHKLDTNHLVFSIKGSSSAGPLPAGAYKLKGSQDGDVSVEFSQNDFQITPKVDLALSALENVPLGFSKAGVLTIKNLSSVSILNTTVSFQAENLKLLTPNYSLIDIILPGEEKAVVVKVRSSLDNQPTAQIKTNLNYDSGGNNFTREENFKVTLSPIFLSSWLSLILVFLGALSAVLVVLFISRQIREIRAQ